MGPLESIERALKEITRKTGVFSMDPETHARNCVENMAEHATAALSDLRRLREGSETWWVGRDVTREDGMAMFSAHKNAPHYMERVTVLREMGEG